MSAQIDLGKHRNDSSGDVAAVGCSAHVRTSSWMLPPVCARCDLPSVGELECQSATEDNTELGTTAMAFCTKHTREVRITQEQQVSDGCLR